MALTDKRAAFFDVDNTLIRGSTIYFLGRGMYQRGYFTKKDISRFVLANLRFRLTGKEKKEENLLNYINGLKKCSRCEEVKPLSDFYKNSKTSDKLTSWCKCCTKERHLAYQRDNVVKEQNDNRGTDH